MQLGMIGLGRMGANIVRRLMRDGHECVVYDVNESAIAQLPETQRMAVVLRRYDDLSYEQIADVLDQSVPAVKSLLFRARTELRTRLSRYLAN